jgi:hypothetical protein
MHEGKLVQPHWIKWRGDTIGQVGGWHMGATIMDGKYGGGRWQ